MLSEPKYDDDVVVGSVLAASAFIGVIGAGQTADAGVVMTWLWVGIGLSVIYLLYRLVVTLERLVDAI